MLPAPLALTLVSVITARDTASSFLNENPISQPSQDQFLIFQWESPNTFSQNVEDAERLYLVKIIQKGQHGEQAATLLALASLSVDIIKLPHWGLQTGSPSLHKGNRPDLKLGTNMASQVNTCTSMCCLPQQHQNYKQNTEQLSSRTAGKLAGWKYYNKRGQEQRALRLVGGAEAWNGLVGHPGVRFYNRKGNGLFGGCLRKQGPQAHTSPQPRAPQLGEKVPIGQNRRTRTVAE